MYSLAVYYLNTYNGAECYFCCGQKIRSLRTQIYKLLLTYGTKQQEPAVWPPALAILLKESLQIKRYFSRWP